MAHALRDATESSALRSHPRMAFRSAPFSYEIAQDGPQIRYRVTDGKATISEPVAYVFGNAHVAQTFVLQRNGRLYEGRVSYFTAIDGLDWTIGDALNPPPSLEEAFGREIGDDEARNCFSCHGTAATVSNRLRLDGMIPGVTCEACHGPGGRHAEAMRSGTADSLDIFNPKTLDPDTLSQEFCGACHRGANTVGMMPDLGGINNIRFQPYRISLSRGHDVNDKHFACTACHDPHVDLQQELSFYDSNCTACHRQGEQGLGNESAGSMNRGSPHLTAKICPVARERCVSCHMPKVELPGAHFKFTDHRVRIARPGDAYPH